MSEVGLEIMVMALAEQLQYPYGLEYDLTLVLRELTI